MPRNPNLDPMLVRFTSDEREVVRRAAAKGIDPRVPESTYVKACALMFSLALEDKRGVELLGELGSYLTRKHMARPSARDMLRVFGT